MNYYLKRVVFVTFLLLFSLVSSAEQGYLYVPQVGECFRNGDIAYRISCVDPLEVEVTYVYNEVQFAGLRMNYSGDVVIPETITRVYSGTWNFTVTGIGDDAFQYGSEMTSLTIPKTVTEVSSSAFTKATSLTSLTISDATSELSLSSGTFRNSPIKNLYIGRYISATSSPFTGSTEIELSLGNGINSVFTYLFCAARALKSVTLPSGLITIGESAFSYCSALQSITIPKTVTTVSKGAFRECKGLKNVIIEDGDSEIGFDNQSGDYDCFYYCAIDSLYLGRNFKMLNSTSSNNLFTNALTKVAIGDKVTLLPDNLFTGCKKLTSVHFGKNIASMGTNVFNGCSSLVDIDLTSKLTVLPPSSFTRCSALKSVTFPSGLITIGESAFSYCSALQSITIPKTVTTVSKGAFRECKGLKNVIIEDGDSEIGFDNQSGDYDCFYYCAIDSLYLGRNIKMLNSTSSNDLFTNALTKVAIGDKVTLLPDNLFNGCSKITRVYAPWEQPITIAKKVFSDAAYTNATLFVPGGTVKKYRATSAWNQFANIVPTAIGVTMTATEGGSIRLGDEVVCGSTKLLQVKPNAVLTFEITSEDDYLLESVIMNGQDVTAQLVDGRLTANDLSEDLEIVATFKAKPYFDITATTSGGGTATIGSASVMWGCSTTVTLTPDEGHELKNVTVNNIDKTDEVVDGVLTLSDIRENMTVVAAFQKLRFTITVTCNEGGSILLSNQQPEWGDDVTVTIIPNEDYRLASLTVDDNNVTSEVTNMQYTISNVTNNMEVIATFRSTVAFITLNGNGVSTYCSDQDLDFSQANGIKAYIVSGYYPQTGYVLLTRITEVPANTGIVVKGDNGTYKVPYGETSAYYMNMLVGNVDPITIEPTEGLNTNLCLVMGDNDFGFYQIAETMTMSANSARLQLPTSIFGNESRCIKIIYEEDDVALGINGTPVTPAENTVYDLRGRKVNDGKLLKGIYIRNGKKVMVK